MAAVLLPGKPFYHSSINDTNELKVFPHLEGNLRCSDLASNRQCATYADAHNLPIGNDSLGYDNNDDSESHETKQAQEVYDASYQRIRDTEDNKFTVTDVGAKGCEIHLNDCMISFPEGAVSEVTPIAARLYIPTRDKPETTLPGHVDITPTVECKPRGTNFLKPITFRVPTWVKSFYTSRHDHQVNAKVLCGKTQSNGNVVWDTIGTVEIGREDYIEFTCLHFCKFKACIEGREVVYYGVDYFLCCDNNNNFTVVVCLSNETTDYLNRLLEKYSSSVHKLKIMPNDDISVCENEKLVIKVACENPQFTSSPNDEEEMIVDEAFWQLDKYRTFDFVLKREVDDGTSPRVKINLQIKARSDRSRSFQVFWKNQQQEKNERATNRAALSSGPPTVHVTSSNVNIAAQRSSVNRTKDIGAEGGEIQLDDCMISFPQGAVSEVTPVSARLYIPTKDNPESTLPGCVDITPTVECGPRGVNFLKPITFRVPTWVKSFYTSHHDHQVVAKALCGKTQSNGDVVWDTIGTVEIGREDYIEFTCSHFGKLKFCIEGHGVVYYRFDSFLCCDNNNNFTVVVCLSNETLCNRLLEKYINSVHELKIMPTDHITVGENEKLRIRMVCETPQFSFGDNEEEMIVDEAFCQLDKYRTFDFVLGREVDDGTSPRVKINLRFKARSDRSRQIQVSWKNQRPEKNERASSEVATNRAALSSGPPTVHVTSSNVNIAAHRSSVNRTKEISSTSSKSEVVPVGGLKTVEENKPTAKQEISPAKSKSDVAADEDKWGKLEEARAVTHQGHDSNANNETQEVCGASEQRICDTEDRKLTLTEISPTKSKSDVGTHDDKRGTLERDVTCQAKSRSDVRTEEHIWGIPKRAVTRQEISPTKSKSDVRVKEDKSGTLEEARAVTHQEQVIDPAGGVINATDCKIVFHEGTFEAPTTVKVTMEVDSTRVPEEYILIAPILYVESEFPLEKPASIELRSWCVSDGSPESKGAEVDIIHKSDDSENWKRLTTLPLTENSVFEFTCQNFSPIGAVMELIGLGSYVKYSICGYLHYIHHSNFEVIFFHESETLAKKIEEKLQKYPITINQMDVKPNDQITAALESDSEEYTITPVDGQSFKVKGKKKGFSYPFRFRLERNKGTRAARRVKLTSIIKINGVDQDINPFNQPLTPETSESSNEEIDTDNQEPSESSEEKTDSDPDNKGGTSSSFVKGDRSKVYISGGKVNIGAYAVRPRKERKKNPKKRH